MNGQGNRDRSLEQLLRKSLTSEPVTPEACIDAETLAAWVAGGLDDHALRLAETHLATCARCQGVVRAMAIEVPPPPQTTASAPWWHSARWLVPLAAGAAAVTLWMVVPGQRSPVATPAPPAAELGDKPVAQSSPAPPQTPAAPPEVQKQQPQEARPLTRDSRADNAAPRKTEERPAAEADRQAAAPAAPAAVPPPAALGARNEVAGRVRQEAFREVVSNDARTRWRLRGGGSVERSDDSGATWEVLSTGAAGELTAASAPSALVCWVVGRGGAVLLTSDASRWERKSFPEPVDLVAVQATDERNATVTTADGRVFRTSDGGATWVLQGF